MQSKKSYDEAIKAAEAAKKSHDPEIRRYADLILSSASYYNWIFS